MRSLRIICWWLILGTGLFLLHGCSDDDTIINTPQPPPPPINIFGAPASLDEGLDMMLMWTDTSSGITGSYNIYRKIGAGAAVKLNSTPVSASGFGPQDYYPKALWFVDTAYDTASDQTYLYYIKAVNSNGESVPSDSVLCIPNTIDTENNPYANLSPDNAETGMIPTFSWDSKAEASSYFLMLTNDREYQNYWAWWIYRGTDTLCDINSASGTTYLNTITDSLEADHEFSWVLWAVDAHNCGFAKGMASFKTLDPDFLMTFVNGTLDAGRYRICWPQTNLSGRQVAPGPFEVRMTAGDFDTTIAFDIVTPGTSVGPAEVQDCDEDFGIILPVSYALDLNAEGYLVGDTVKITFDLPVSTMVKVDIAR